MISEIVVLVADEFSVFHERIVSFLENEGFRISMLSKPNGENSDAPLIEGRKRLLPGDSYEQAEGRLRAFSAKEKQPLTSVIYTNAGEAVVSIESTSRHKPPNISKSTWNHLFGCL